jgi:DNA invertase Pin-like site-specific DNA recombinase
MTVIGAYMRVSTQDQNCASQRHAIEKWLAARPDCEVRWYQDDGISGTKLNRPGLQALLRDVESGEVQVVVCWRLDRITRTAAVGLRILLNWIESGTEFFALDQPILQLGKDNPLRLTIAALLSELAAMERDAIAGRVKAGLAAARARGVRLGAVAKLDDKQVARVRELKARGLRHKDIAKQMQVSPATISRALQRREA